MRAWIVLCGVVVLAVLAVGLMSGAPADVAVVSDAEAAALYGGCVDGDPDHVDVSCGEGGEGNCSLTNGYSKFLTNGSGKEENVNCGASSCGTVPMTSGTCDV